ncbi:nuclear transport factor 2 family protein [Noviherbaspirillum aridicola]|uniref:SnoaL-like domain-containing protein n=1 Tax=Noviherbaspirillum aridicola TaxID=2849687 RepID=A0ABQ4PZN9_9BURK|nr:nuclear transport factor 2 family protein [Noviherbaspirillum aridicola]GIZ50378.1 hypothetical protein NCCP691_03920 [Noviherbaspirillum aridicola]
MNAQENKQLVMQGYQNFANRDIQGILDKCTDDIEWFGADNDVVPFAGSFHGKQGVEQFFTTMAGAQEYMRFDPQQFIAEDDTVVVLGQMQARIHASGQTYESPWAHVFRLRDGKICSFQHFGDTAASERAYSGIRAGAGARPDATLSH